MTTPGPNLGPLTTTVTNANAGATTTAVKAPPDLYGLGPWGTQTVNPGDLPILASVIGSGKPTTGNAIVQAFAKTDPGTLATIQRALLLGGFYGTKKYSPTYGVLAPQDVSAFAKAVTVAGQSNGSVSEVLLQHAQYGTIAGVAAARAAIPKRQVDTVSLPNTQDLESDAVKDFQDELGRKATPSEAAAFAAAYQAMSAGMQRAGNQAAYDTSTANAGGLSAGQEADLQQQVSQVGEPNLPGSTTTAEFDNPTAPQPGSANAAENDQQNGLLTAQDTPVQPNFSDEMASLGAVAAQAQQDAVPRVTKASAAASNGLTQVDQESPEDPNTAAANFAQNEDPNAAAAHSLAGQFDNFLAILAGNFGGSTAA